MSDMQPCGTVAAYARHRKSGEQPCNLCLKAWASYQAEYRLTHKPSERVQKNQAARARAFTRLRREHPKRFQELYQEELAR